MSAFICSTVQSNPMLRDHLLSRMQSDIQNISNAKKNQIEEADQEISSDDDNTFN
jgi:hypothetical protein